MSKPIPRAVEASGFTEFDLATLNQLSAEQMAQQRWRHVQIVHESFADYLAVWNAGGSRVESPHLTIARFRRTGTYALSVNGVVVATASSLRKILPLPTGREVQNTLVPA
jgi:hypothetical protein